jgi:pimeloyl-ACP methyl ester carboxylesterase
VLTHGWPGSVLEFEKILGPLTDPVAHGGSAEDAFHVVVPSLPGFGFSDQPRERGWNPGRTARAWAELMSVLGYERFGAHGGDWGAYISIELARLVPERVSGLHLTMPLASPLPEDRISADDAEKRMIEKRDQFLMDGFGFVMIQGSRPQTLGYSLLDSPAGLAAWLGEKLLAFADTRPESGGEVSLAHQLDNIALYWFTGTGASTARWYWEAIRWVPRSAEEENAQPVTVPNSPAMGRAPLSQPHLMERDEPRWTLPRLGTAGSSGCRTQKRIPPCAGQFRRRGTGDGSPPSRAQLGSVLRIMKAV